MPTAQQWASAAAVIGSIAMATVATVSFIDIWYWEKRKQEMEKGG